MLSCSLWRSCCFSDFCSEGGLCEGDRFLFGDAVSCWYVCCFAASAFNSEPTALEGDCYFEANNADGDIIRDVWDFDVFIDTEREVS